MEIQTPDDVLARALADEVRGEMARQRKTAADLAVVLGISAHTAGRRLNGSVAFNVVELFLTAAWMDVSPESLISRARSAHHARRPAA